MNFKFLVLLISLTGAACSAPSVNWEPGQEVAVEVIWRGMYQRQNPYPPVEWREPECEIHGAFEGIYSYNIHVPAACVYGFYWLGGGVVVSQTPYLRWYILAHEWLHAKSWLENDGDADPLHWRMDWSLPDKARIAMAGLGY